MNLRPSADRWLAFFFCAAALLLIFVWVPLDTGTGLVEKVRRKFVIGDALAPTVAGVVILLGALLSALRPQEGKGLEGRNLIWLLSLLGLFAASMLIVRYAGPVALSGVDGGYRPLRATAPWNYIGFLIGGTLLVGGLTGLANRKFMTRDFLIGFAATLIIALMYDLPFEDLILPPNGDI